MVSQVAFKLPYTAPAHPVKAARTEAPDCRKPGAGRARALLCAATLTLMSGCATNSVMTLMKASGQHGAIAPSAAIVQAELKGRAIDVGTVAFDLQKAADKQGLPDVPDSVYLELIDSQLKKAFTGAALGKGTAPAYPVNVAIEELKLKPAIPLFLQISTFGVRIEIVGESGTVLLRGRFRSYVSSPGFTVFAGGVVVPVALPAENYEYVALAKMFPAVAIVTAATANGLQQGQTLDEIRIYPQDIEAGNIISPDLFLKDAPFGMSQMNAKDIARVIQAAQARSGR